MNAHKKYSLNIGRWQPLHFGHKSLFDSQLAQGKNVLIAIRDIEPDFNQPLTPEQVKDLIETVYAKEIADDERVKVIIMPDIESVNYGRGVGYAINEFIPDTTIASISATGIRESIRNKDDK